jgi:hypothetical protein
MYLAVLTVSVVFGGTQDTAVTMLLDAVHHSQQSIKRQKMCGKQALYWKRILKYK